MEDLLTQAPTSLVGWMGIVMAFVFGVMSYFSQRNSETDKEREELIVILKDKLILFDNIRAEVDKLSAENAVLKQLVLGQDTDSKTLKTKAVRAIEQIEFLYEQKINSMKAQNVEAYVNRPLRERQREEHDNANT